MRRKFTSAGSTVSPACRSQPSAFPSRSRGWSPPDGGVARQLDATQVIGAALAVPRNRGRGKPLDNLNGLDSPFMPRIEVGAPITVGAGLRLVALARREDVCMTWRFRGPGATFPLPLQFNAAALRISAGRSSQQPARSAGCRVSVEPFADGAGPHPLDPGGVDEVPKRTYSQIRELVISNAFGLGEFVSFVVAKSYHPGVFSLRWRVPGAILTQIRYRT